MDMIIWILINNSCLIKFNCLAFCILCRWSRFQENLCCMINWQQTGIAADINLQEASIFIIDDWLFLHQKTHQTKKIDAVRYWLPWETANLMKSHLYSVSWHDWKLETFHDNKLCDKSINVSYLFPNSRMSWT